MIGRCSLIVLAGVLMSRATVLAADVDANWTSAVYKGAQGKDQTNEVDPKKAPQGYDGIQRLPAPAVRNDVVLKGDYFPPDSLPTIHVYIKPKGAKGDGEKYIPRINNGTWRMTIPNGKLAATMYEVRLLAVINGHSVRTKTYLLNIPNN